MVLGIVRGNWMTQNTEIQGSPPPPVSRAQSCWYFGCLTIGTMLVVGFLSIYLGGRYFLRTFIAEYTSATRVELPVSAISEERWKGLQARVAAFNQAAESGKGEARLELAAEDINALIARDPRLAEFKGSLWVDLEKEKAKCRFSYLLERLGAKKILHGRYLNGEADLISNLVNGQIYLTLLDIKINGKSVPDTVKPGLQAHNLAEGFNNDPGSSPMIHRLSEVRIHEGKLFLTANGPKPKSPEVK